MKMSIRVVIVDDAPFIREVLTSLLVKNGLAIVGQAQDGVEAVEVAERTQPDVILMDLVMPRKSGVEAAQEILARFPQIRVIAVSTVDQQSLVLRALDAGCCGFVLKPFDAKGLMRAIQNSMGREKREG